MSNKAIRLKDYKAPEFVMEKVELEFDLDKTATIVSAKLYVKNNQASNFFLNGDKDIKLLEVKLDGNDPDHSIDDSGNLTISNVPENFVLETRVEVNPSANTTCEGLYMTDGMFSTQCEAEAFRKITFYPDRPDVLSEFFVTIRCGNEGYNTWLSNGNKISQEKLSDGRMETKWHDPFPKGCYLFALVAGNLGQIQDSFTTMSGRKVELNLFCDKGKEDKLYFAMESLKKSMKWDEEKFGREYDLDVFNIVAVSSFIFGAMENKGLNIFNDVLLLADKDSATDGNYQRILSVVGHEYFHNWSGNRVTLRNWFELSLKEGFTVYRDQEFSADMYSRVTKRIEDVSDLRIAQFPEDNGPLSHPVRASEYISINNFYTATVYEKGSEIVRMYEKILGWDLFKKGCDLYFDKFDGKAVTINDFASCMEEVSGKDFTQFKLWYTQNGTPTIIIETDFSDDIFTVHLKQTQEKFNDPLIIPLEFGLISKDGKELKSGTFILDAKEKTYNFDGIDFEPVLSINRGFSAPVKIDIEYTQEQIETLIKYDSDLFNRYDIGQKFATDMIIQDRIDTRFVELFSSALDLYGTDNEFVSSAMTLPALSYVADYISEIDFDKLISKHEKLSKMIGEANTDKFLQIYNELNTQKPYSPEAKDIANRTMKTVALAYLCKANAGKELALAQYKNADNLTDRIAALSCMAHQDVDMFDECLSDFYDKNKDNHLVVLKWLTLSSNIKRDNALIKTKELLQHDAFEIKNPNKVRALLGGFAANTKYFHAKDGSGYDFISDMIIKIDPINPTVAAGLAKAFSKLKKIDDVRKVKMQSAIDKIMAHKMSPNTKEILEKIIGE